MCRPRGGGRGFVYWEPDPAGPQRRGGWEWVRGRPGRWEPRSDSARRVARRRVIAAGSRALEEAAREESQRQRERGRGRGRGRGAEPTLPGPGIVVPPPVRRRSPSPPAWVHPDNGYMLINGVSGVLKHFHFIGGIDMY